VQSGRPRPLHLTLKRGGASRPAFYLVAFFEGARIRSARNTLPAYSFFGTASGLAICAFFDFLLAVNPGLPPSVPGPSLAEVEGLDLAREAGLTGSPEPAWPADLVTGFAGWIVPAGLADLGDAVVAWPLPEVVEGLLAAGEALLAAGA